jgi:hypothetical protein
METDIGQPVDYNPNIHVPKEPSLQQEDTSSPIDEYMQPHMYMEAPPPPHQHVFYPPPSTTAASFDITSLDKNTYLMAFVAFLLGFFMGKTMISPVIFRNP